MSPAVIANVKNDMRIAQEEVFGPFVTLHPFDSEEDAIMQARTSVVRPYAS